MRLKLFGLGLLFAGGLASASAGCGRPGNYGVSSDGNISCHASVFRGDGKTITGNVYEDNVERHTYFAGSDGQLGMYFPMGNLQRHMIRNSDGTTMQPVRERAGDVVHVRGSPESAPFEQRFEEIKRACTSGVDRRKTGGNKNGI